MLLEINETMKKSLILLCCLLTGCTVDGWMMHQAVEKCQSHNGISHYNAVIGSGVCQDGTVFDVKAIHNTQ